MGMIIVVIMWYLLLIPFGLAMAVFGLYLSKVYPWQKWAGELNDTIKARDTEAFRQMLAVASERCFMRTSTVLMGGYARKGDIDSVAFMLDNGAFGAQRAFVSAAGEDQVEMMEWLLHRGAALDYIEGNWPTALISAAHLGKVRAVRFLLERGADPNIRKSDGTTALTWARRRRHNEVVRILEEYGATV